jgi:hypothetical protein
MRAAPFRSPRRLVRAGRARIPVTRALPPPAADGRRRLPGLGLPPVEPAPEDPFARVPLEGVEVGDELGEGEGEGETGTVTGACGAGAVTTGGGGRGTGGTGGGGGVGGAGVVGTGSETVGTETVTGRSTWPSACAERTPASTPVNASAKPNTAVLAFLAIPLCKTQRRTRSCGYALCCRPGAHSSAGERPLHTREVPGSIPGAPIQGSPIATPGTAASAHAPTALV